MANRSVDLLDIIDKVVYHIDYENLEVIEETLIPTSDHWYSYSKDKYILETEIYDTKEEALEILLGAIITAKKEVILTLASKEQEIINLLNPELINEGLIG